MSSPQPDNRFLTAPLGRLFLGNALPMMLIMLMSGLLNIVDAAFLGQFVGADALAAVSLIFPILMVTIAISTLVSGGMASLLARHLGAGQRDAAAKVFAGAHGLALFLALLLILAFAMGGHTVTRFMSGGREDIDQMAYTYLAISFGAAPVQLLLGVHADAMRNEGKAAIMALNSVGVTLTNILLNYVLIVRLDMGVAGSAWGTVLAQSLGLAVLLLLRLRGHDLLPLRALVTQRWNGHWRVILGLGAPLSLSFIGIALVSGVALTALRLTLSITDYAVVVAGYGVVTRIMGFVFLPLMAIALATQSIVGNNVGAGLFLRSDRTLRIALSTALLYCLTVEALLQFGRFWIGSVFVSDAEVIASVAVILRPMTLFYIVTGPILTLALYFQAIGQPLRAAALTLVKPFILSPLLITGLALVKGGAAIWSAFPIVDLITTAIALIIVVRCRRATSTETGFGITSVEGAR